MMTTIAAIAAVKYSSIVIIYGITDCRITISDLVTNNIHITCDFKIIRTIVIVVNTNVSISTTCIVSCVVDHMSVIVDFANVFTICTSTVISINTITVCVNSIIFSKVVSIVSWIFAVSVIIVTNIFFLEITNISANTIIANPSAIVNCFFSNRMLG